MSKKLVVGNWKMNGDTKSGAALVKEIASKAPPSVDVCVCPPAIYLQSLMALEGAGSLTFGTQDCSYHSRYGAYTGEISSAMIKDAGASYVILGHSERRQYYGESNEVVSKKTLRAHEEGLNAIVCVGETLSEREAGIHTSVVIMQLMESLPPSVSGVNLVVAYEPVWAIGTGKTATTEDIREMHGVIRRFVQEKLDNPDSIRILYGGSVKAENAAEIFAVENVDGALVGGASLKADQFLAIIDAAK